MGWRADKLEGIEGRGQSAAVPEVRRWLTGLASIWTM